ncbi:MAG: amidohydrolase [Myxococcales bacterium]|nr:amidohydrolase [Myxococcales bacterium]
MCAVIDLHNHMVTEDVVRFLEEHGQQLETTIEHRRDGRFARIGASAERPLHARMCGTRARLPDMDKQGVDVQAVSCTPFVMYPDADRELGIELARVNNDSLARLADEAPALRRGSGAVFKRFVPIASVPLAFPEDAAAELARAVALGHRGVEIPPRAGELELDDRRLDPFWAAASAARVPVCIHPFDASPAGALSRYRLAPLAGNPMDTGLAAALLLLGGVFDRFPALRVALYHGGGTLAALLPRLDRGYEQFPETRAAASQRPSAYIGQLHVDTIALDPAWLRHLLSRFGPRRMVLGTDYPLPLGPRDPVGDILALALPAEDERRILGDNAARLLQRGALEEPDA